MYCTRDSNLFHIFWKPRRRYSGCHFVEAASFPSAELDLKIPKNGQLGPFLSKRNNMYMAASGSTQSQAPMIPLAHPMYRTQSHDGADASIYPQATGDSSASPTSVGTCDNLSENHESPPMASAAGLAPSAYSNSIVPALAGQPIDHYHGTDHYQSQPGQREGMQTFGTTVRKQSEIRSTTNGESGVEEDRRSDGANAGNNPPGSVRSIRSNSSVTSEQISSPYEVAMNGVAAGSSRYPTSSYSPMDNTTSASSTHLERMSYSHTPDEQRCGNNFYQAPSHSSSYPRDNHYSTFYPSYPVPSSATAQGAIHHPSHLNPYPLSISSYTGSQAMAGGMLPPAPDPSEVPSLAHAPYGGSSADGWSGHTNHGYGAIDYTRFPMPVPGHLSYAYQDALYCSDCKAPINAAGWQRTAGHILCSTCLFRRRSEQMRETPKSRGKAAAPRTQICSNCNTDSTTLWRRSPDGSPVCNACGLYFKLHQVPRPISMKKDSIQTRKRKPKGQGKGKKVQQRRHASPTESQQREGYTGVIPGSLTTTSSSVTASSAVHHTSKANTGTASVPYFTNGGIISNGVQYPSNATRRASRSPEGLENSSMLTSSSLSPTISGGSDTSPAVNNQSACSVKEASVAVSESSHNSPTTRSLSHSGRYSALSNTTDRSIFSSSVANGSYSNVYPAIVYSAGTPNYTSNSIPSLACGSYSADCQTRPENGVTESSNAITASGANFHSAATFIERAASSEESYRSVLSGAYPANESSSAGPTRLYRRTQNHQHFPYPQPLYSKNDSVSHS